MIKKYLEFVNESISMILESDVVYSNKFRSTLNRIDNPISKSILGIENKDIPVRSNYFDIIMDKNDTISFIPDRKAQEILDGKKETVRFNGRSGGWLTYNKKETGEYKNASIFDALGFTPTSDEVYKPEDEVGEVVKKTTSAVSGKTFAWVKFPGGEGVYNTEKLSNIDDGTQKQLWTVSRQELKVGRAIRALLGVAGVEVLDKDIEVFVNLYKSTIDKMNDVFSLFDEVSGDDIGYWYNYNRYYRRSGTLGGSCMSDVPTEFFNIYMRNPDVCKLVILRSVDDNEKIVGRALLWTLVDGKRFMDRMYAINDSDVQLFRDYAKENGWYSKRYNNSGPNQEAISPDGSISILDVTVNIKPGEYDSYPYLDTLKYWNRKGTLSTKSSSGSHALESTDGDYYNCDNCGGEGSVECYDCDGDGTVSCDECRGRGKVSCEECDGSGTLENGDKCDCEGGKVDCEDCDGGRAECNNCGGSGRVDCDEC